MGKDDAIGSVNIPVSKISSTGDDTGSDSGIYLSIIFYWFYFNNWVIYFFILHGFYLKSPFWFWMNKTEDGDEDEEDG